MKLIVAIFFLFLCSRADGQEYRLTYDASEIPELYQRVRLVLEEKNGKEFHTYEGRIRINNFAGTLDGLDFSYTQEDLKATGGTFSFEVFIEGRKHLMQLKIPKLESLRFQLYTDSIKPILNYYVNVEGVFSSGKIFPLGPEQVRLSSDVGFVTGMEWKAPKIIDFEKVLFSAVSLTDSSIKAEKTVYLKKYADPRDAENFSE